MVRKRPLTPEEQYLWEQATRHDKPLKNIKRAPIDKDSGKIVEKPVLQKVKLGAKRNNPVINTIIPKPPVFSQEKKIGDYAGIDRNTAERFRKGDAPIDARLDLHGMTSEKAHKALVAFIKQQVKFENRRLLVITGKGSGILRSSLPNWLTTANLSGHILAFDVAKAKHGGDGAYYILLKRKRS